MDVAYVRVSSDTQNPQRQLEVLKPYKIERIYEEKISGKDMKRPQLQAMLDFVREGDKVYVSEFSRLARSTKDLLTIIETLDEKGVSLISLKENLDTKTSTGRLMVGIIASINQFEREQIKERQMAGIKIAKEAGKYKGRQVKKIDDNTFRAAYEDYRHRSINKVQLAKRLRISRPTLDKMLKEKGLM